MSPVPTDPTPPDADATWLEILAEHSDLADPHRLTDHDPVSRFRAIAARLRAQAAALAEAERERDEAIKEHGKESGFWGTAAARCLARAEAAERDRDEAARVRDDVMSLRIVARAEAAEARVAMMTEALRDSLVLTCEATIYEEDCGQIGTWRVKPVSGRAWTACPEHCDDGMRSSLTTLGVRFTPMADILAALSAVPAPPAQPCVCAAFEAKGFSVEMKATPPATFCATCGSICTQYPGSAAWYCENCNNARGEVAAGPAGPDAPAKE